MPRSRAASTMVPKPQDARQPAQTRRIGGRAPGLAASRANSVCEHTLVQSEVTATTDKPGCATASIPMISMSPEFCNARGTDPHACGVRSVGRCFGFGASQHYSKHILRRRSESSTTRGSTSELSRMRPTGPGHRAHTRERPTGPQRPTGPGREALLSVSITMPDRSVSAMAPSPASVFVRSYLTSRLIS